MKFITRTWQSIVPVSAQELAEWHTRPGALERLVPPWERIRIVRLQGQLTNATQQVVFRWLIAGLIPYYWQAEVCDYQPGVGFVDVQRRGPFASWKHTHRFLPQGDEQSILQDEVTYSLRWGALGRWLTGSAVSRRLDRLFQYRHAITASDLRRHNRYRSRPRLRIVVTGSRGLIGSALVPFLTSGGHQVVRLLSTEATPPYDDGTAWHTWLPGYPAPKQLLANADAVIHLAGENIAAGRWTSARKQRMYESRVATTYFLSEALEALAPQQRPRTFLCASAIGYYGHRDQEELTEDSASGSGFLPELCQQWEVATQRARNVGVRTVLLRFGAVLSPQGGALAKQLTAFRYGLGAVLGNGRQWFSWIALPDAIAAIHHCLMEESLHGPVNIVAPDPVVNYDFAKTLGRVLRRPVFLRLPARVLRILFGELADQALLVSTRVYPRRLIDNDFTFDFPQLEPALRFLLGR